MKKAFDFFNQNGIDYQFFDYKKLVLSQNDFEQFVATFGEKTINKQGTTYKKLSDDEKAVLAGQDLSASYEIIKHNQSVLKRPIVLGEFDDKEVALIGFDEEVWRKMFVKSY